jgi:hypothetical protein
MASLGCFDGGTVGGVIERFRKLPVGRGLFNPDYLPQSLIHCINYPAANYQMYANPFEDHTSNQGQSKPKVIVNTLLPLTARQIHALIAHKHDLSTLGRIVIVGRVISLKEMVGRTQVKVTDETGMLTVV